MSFFESIKTLIVVCQLVCLSPFALKNYRGYSKLFNLRKIFIYSIIFTQFLIIICCIVFNNTFVQTGFARAIKTFDATVLTLIQFTALIIFIESYRKRLAQVDFLQKINTIDFILKFKIGIHLNYVEQKWSNLKRLIRWIAIDISVFVINVLVIKQLYPENTVLHWWLMISLSFFICSMRYFQIVSYVYLIRYRYHRMNQFINNSLFIEERITFNLDLATTLQNYGRNLNGEIWDKTTSRDVYQKLVDLRRVYRLISSASRNINQIFQWSIPIIISNDVLHMLINMYWILRLIIQKEKSAFYLVVPSLWTAINLNHLLSLSSLCHHASEEVKELI